MQEKRAAWKKRTWSDKRSRLVFLDESSVNIDMTRRYGRSIGQKRVVDHVPLGTPRHVTILSSIRSDGSTAFTTYSGGTTGKQFVSYLKETLIPTLHPGDIVIMDNMRSHHVKEVAETLYAAGIMPLYLPPYSPDLNPIEKLWSKLKSILRSWKVRNPDKLPDAIQQAFQLIRPADCLHWFAACGYC